MLDFKPNSNPMTWRSNMTTRSSLHRQWEMARLLAGRRYGISVRELARELEVSLKTVRRDIQSLEEIGFPLEENTGGRQRKTYRLEGDWRQALLELTYDEALAIYIGQRFIEPSLNGTFVSESASVAFRKIRASLGERVVEYLDRVAARLQLIHIGASDYADKADLLDELLIAVEEQLQTIITYQSLRATEPVTYEIHPYGVVVHRGSIYLIAFSRDHDEIRTFKLDRIAEAEVSKHPFQPVDGFELTAYLADSFGIFTGSGQIHVTVRFLPPVVTYVKEKRWHKSQLLTPQPDGSIQLDLTVPSLVEIKSWLLSFGANALVLEPLELRDAMAAEARQMSRLYEEAEEAAIDPHPRE